MNTHIKILAAACATLVMNGNPLHAQTFGTDELSKVQQIVTAAMPSHMGIGNVKARSIGTSGDTIVVDMSENFSDLSFTRAGIDKMKANIKDALNTNQPLKITIDSVDVDNFLIDFDTSYQRSHAPFLVAADKNRHYRKALDGNIVALWPSHGLYFENSLNRWEWQRGRLFQTVEDMYTHSYVIPFLIPMLENAGAYVWDARERDTHDFAAIVDNDGGKASASYHEKNGQFNWTTGKGSGYACLRDEYRDFENPFAEGTYRQAQCTNDKRRASVAMWDVELPEAGTYSIYVSYKSLPNSAKDAHYTVNSMAGPEEFTLDQRMAGGVWVHLGRFQLNKGLNKDVLCLSNLSKDATAVVTADAIKVGGGKNVIARRVALPNEENKRLAQEQGNESKLGKPGIDYKYVGSGDYPLFEIGSRYYLQSAGFPPSVYSESKGINDYTDDYRCRGAWVNYLAGGSSSLPAQTGLKVPVDVSFCLHSDAGVTQNDDIVGTLVIYCTKKDGKMFGRYENGTPRNLSRQFADIVTSQVVNDIRAKYEPNWTRRGMRDASYYEARVPEVPALLMELLSHQNFADMKLGLDPNFRFDVSRAIYKGILKFIARRDHRDYVVQPLPVNSFYIDRVSDNCFILNWKPTKDELSDHADAQQYIVLERIGDGGFKEIAVTKDTRYVVYPKANLIHSYKIIALNDGGRSFPSETLSLGVTKNSKGYVAVINGFTRLSAPDWWENGDYAGFNDAKDHGVDYVQQINYVGPQIEYNRHRDWVDDDDTGFGDSQSTHEKEPVAGNTFDYTGIHGQSILNAGYSFVAMSADAFRQNCVFMNDFKAIDLILGKQKEVKLGRGAFPNRYKIFTPDMMQAIARYTAAGGSVLMTGAYVGSDLWQNEHSTVAERDFASNTLGYKFRAARASANGQAYSTTTSFASLHDGLSLTFTQKLNRHTYAVESPDAIFPSSSRSEIYLFYSENNKPAAVASDFGTYRAVVAGFPFETIEEGSARDTMMSDVLHFLTDKKTKLQYQQFKSHNDE